MWPFGRNLRRENKGLVAEVERLVAEVEHLRKATWVLARGPAPVDPGTSVEAVVDRMAAALTEAQVAGRDHARRLDAEAVGALARVRLLEDLLVEEQREHYAMLQRLIGIDGATGEIRLLPVLDAHGRPIPLAPQEQGLLNRFTDHIADIRSKRPRV